MTEYAQRAPPSGMNRMRKYRPMSVILPGHGICSISLTTVDLLDAVDV